jgi:hypothetical protein
MKTTTYHLIAIVSIVALGLSASTASAANNNKKKNNQQNNSYQSGVSGILDLISQFKDKDDDDSKPPQTDPKPIDPGMGNGTTNPVSPPSRPGYVWVGDHWEREKAPQTVTTGKPGYVWVGDHWEREKAPSGMTMIVDPIPGQTLVGGKPIGTGQPIVTGQQLVTAGGVVVRDHRRPPVVSGNGGGGVTVTSSGTSRPKPSGGLLGTVTGGLSTVTTAVGNAAGSVGQAVGAVGGGSQSAPPMKITVIRDHRD